MDILSKKNNVIHRKFTRLHQKNFLYLVAGILNPTNGIINVPSKVRFCHNRTDFMPEQFNELIYAYKKEAYSLKVFKKISADWLNRWNTLRHGERKRGQIVVAMWQMPQFLRIDKPTNYLPDLSVYKYINCCSMQDYLI